MRFEEELEFALCLGLEGIIEASVLMGKELAVTTKVENEQVTNIDRGIDAFLVKRIKDKYPMDAILSEETQDDPSRLENERTWIIDPIDGTKELIQYINSRLKGSSVDSGSSLFAIHIGLQYQHRAVVGVVTRPVTGEVFYAAEGVGAYFLQNDIPTKMQRNDAPSLADAKVGVSPNNYVDNRALAFRLGLSDDNIMRIPTVGAKMCAVAKGEIDCYMAINKRIKEWDLCAPHVIARESGVLVTDRFGEEIGYNRKHLTRASIFVAPPGLHEELLQRYRNSQR